VSQLLARLERRPIPAPSAAQPRQLTYGDLLIDLFLEFPAPAQWPQPARDSTGPHAVTDLPSKAKHNN